MVKNFINVKFIEVANYTLTTKENTPSLGNKLKLRSTIICNYSQSVQEEKKSHVSMRVKMEEGT